jgi:hypothetical protein
MECREIIETKIANKTNVAIDKVDTQRYSTLPHLPKQAVVLVIDHNRLTSDIN